jgi:hypothetical protein
MSKQKKGYIVDKRTDPAQVICEKCPGFTYDIVVGDPDDQYWNGKDWEAVGPHTEFTCIECGHEGVDYDNKIRA